MIAIRQRIVELHREYMLANPSADPDKVLEELLESNPEARDIFRQPERR